MGGNLKFDKVKMPSGGGLSFEVINEDGEAEPVKEIIGVVLDHYPINAIGSLNLPEKRILLIAAAMIAKPEQL